MDKTTQLEQRIIALEKQLKDLQTSSSIPLNLDKALQGRNFAKINPQLYPYETYYIIDSFLKVENPSGNVPYFLPIFIIDESTP
jgi:hypothetical protein